jgi:hypothetical protein
VHILRGLTADKRVLGFGSPAKHHTLTAQRYNSDGVNSDGVSSQKTVASFEKVSGVTRRQIPFYIFDCFTPRRYIPEVPIPPIGTCGTCIECCL